MRTARIDGVLRWAAGAALLWMGAATASAQSAKERGWGSDLIAPLTQWNMPQWKVPSLKMPAWQPPELGWPELPQPKEPAFVRATREGLGRAWSATRRTTKDAWETTKYYLRPYDPREARRGTARQRADRDTGFWAGLFGKSEPRRESSVHDFLRQPRPL
jgi:hypothetical protein